MNELLEARMLEWDYENEDFDRARFEVLKILKEQKVSLSKVRLLFHTILNDIEDKNPIVM